MRKQEKPSPAQFHLSTAILIMVLAGGLIGGVIWVFSLDYLPLPEPRLDYQVSDSDMIGTWVFTPKTLEMIRTHAREPKGKYIIQIYPNGSCDFDSFIDGGKHIKSKGRWFLMHDIAGDTLEKEKNLLIIQIENGTRHELNYSISEKDGELILWSYFGDPDHSQAIRYKKSK